MSKIQSCSNCGTIGHKAPTCPQPPVPSAPPYFGPPRPLGTCAWCNAYGPVVMAPGDDHDVPHCLTCATPDPWAGETDGVRRGPAYQGPGRAGKRTVAV